MMENNQVSAGEGTSKTINSGEEQKAFLLRLASELCPGATEDVSEKRRLEMLHSKLKRYSKLFQTLHTYPWGENEPEIQKACGNYLMDSNVSRGKRDKLNEMLYQHNLLINELISFGDMINYTLSNCCKKVEEVGKMIREKKE